MGVTKWKIAGEVFDLDIENRLLKHFEETGWSVEKIDLLFGDRETNWAASACASGSSPGDGPCFP